MDNFNFQAPTRVIFGKNTESQAGALCKQYGAHKVLVHFGGNSAKKSGLLDRVCASLQEAG
ncbi:MAG: iron-containing alcohol dehydrogenase, partial [Phascolarctobacterium sp.]|nr:iron-containing alcohol dehydrogenase [Phascolarctobacterium sp.]